MPIKKPIISIVIYQLFDVALCYHLTNSKMVVIKTKLIHLKESDDLILLLHRTFESIFDGVNYALS